jgi:PAS domain S-box-containing protein
MELEGLSWTVAQLRQLKTIYAPSVADLPEPRKSIAQSFTVQSYIAVPIAYEGCLIGSLAFNSIRTTKTWSAEDAALLRTLADIFASALMRKRVEQALRQSEALYRTLSEAVPDLIWSCDNEGRFDFVNSRWVEYTGLTLEELNAGGSQQVNHPDEYPQLRQQWELAKQNSETFEAEFQYRRRDGIYRWFLARAVPLKDAEGNIVKWIGTSTDIHDRKQAEEQLEASLQEKEALLKEVHHRVKNNLQVISSLLDLQSQRIQEPQILDVFRNSQTRVRSMALIHEKLYQSENLSKVNLADYIESLAMYLIQSYAINPDKITLQLHLEPVALNLDTAIPCGLILNELVSNALKYGFPENTGGTLWIELRCLHQGIPYEERNTFELIVRNDGLKLPEIPDFSTAKSLGFQLVNILVQQLRGQIEVNQSQNTEFKLRFSSPLNAA